MSTIMKLMKDGIITENPNLVQLIGMCPTMAISTSLVNGIGMGLAATAVLIGSNLVISLLRKMTPNKIRIAVYVVIIAGFVTIIDLLMQAFTPGLSKSLGLFIPLIVVNCIILARAEAFASKNNVIHSAIDGLAMGLGFTFTLCILSVIREILGNGTILGFPILGTAYQPAIILVLPVGGFLTLGAVIAAKQKLSSRKGSSK